jgi:hypothetical protein
LGEFKEFCKSNSADYIVEKIDMDINRWLPNFNLFYFTLEYSGSELEVKKIITERVSETDFDK